MLTGAGTGASVALGLLVLATVFVAAVLPRASDGLRTRALRQTLAELPTGAATVIAGIDLGDYGGFAGGGTLSQQLSGTERRVARFLAARGIPLRRGAAWAQLTSGELAMEGAGPGSAIGTNPLQLQLGYSDALRRNARLTAGHWPDGDTGPPGATTFQVAVTLATARLLALHVGSGLSTGTGVGITVSGIIAPVAPGSAFWSQFASTAAPTLISPPNGEGSYWIGGAFVGPSELAAAAPLDFGHTQLSWVFPLDLRHATAGQAARLLAVLTAAGSQGAAQMAIPGGTGESLTVSSGVTPTMASFVAAQATVAGISSLLFVSLTAVGLVVVLMGTQLVADRRREEFATMSARGATGRQLGWLVLRGDALVVLPAAAIAAAAAAALTPGSNAALGWWLAGLTTGCALAAPAFVAARRGTARRRTRSVTTDRRRIRSARRLIAELTLTGCAVSGLVVLRQEGLSLGGSVNVLTSAAPVLVALPAAIAVIRLCPPILRVCRRFAGAGRGLVAYLGLVRAANALARAMLPVFALVLALAVVAFGGSVARSIGQGEGAAAWQLAGADAAVGSPTGLAALPVPAQRAIAAAPGVRAAAPVIEEQGQTGGYATNGVALSVIVVNPRQYAAVLAGAPFPAFPAAALARSAPGRVVPPVLASPGAVTALRAAGGVLTIGTQTTRVRVVAQLAGTPAAPPGVPFLVLPLWAAPTSSPPPVLMLLAGRAINQRQLTAIAARTAPGATVTVRSVELAELSAAPLPRATVLTYAAGAAAAGVFCVLILLISLILDARARELVDARLSTMGLSGSQASRASAIEMVPYMLAAAVGGTLAAAALATLLQPVLNLSALTQSTEPAQLESGIVTPALTVAGLVVLAAVTMIGQRTAARRRAVSEALRVSQ